MAVTREAGKNAALTQLLQRRGAAVTEVPLIEFVTLPPEQATLAQWRDFDGWTVLTSPQGARAYLASGLRGGRLAAVGEATAQPLREAGLSVAFVPSRADALTLARELPAQAGERALHFTSDLSADRLGSELAQRGVVYERGVLYRTASALLSPAQQGELLRADLVTLASGSAAHALAAATGTAKPVAVMGEQTAQVARTLGFKQVRVAQQPTLEALAAVALEAF